MTLWLILLVVAGLAYCACCCQPCEGPTCCGDEYPGLVGVCCDDVWRTGPGVCCDGQWYPAGTAGVCCDDVWQTGEGVCCDGVWKTEAGECCGGVWYPDGTAGECCADVWHTEPGTCCSFTAVGGAVVESWCPDGNHICGDTCCCVPDAYECDEYCCCPFPPHPKEAPSGGGPAACKVMCCTDGVCTMVFPWECAGEIHEGCLTCDSDGCPTSCCEELSSGYTECTTEYELRCDAPRVTGESCDLACAGECCVDGVSQGQTTKDACDALGGYWGGLGSTTCQGDGHCRDPFTENCCETATSGGYGLTFTQPFAKRTPPFTGTVKAVVTGTTDSPILIHGVPVGPDATKRCGFNQEVLLCGDSFNIEPVPCGSRFRKLEVTVCWAEEPVAEESLNFSGCGGITVWLGRCERSCATTMTYAGPGHTSNAEVVVEGGATIVADGSGPLALTGDLTIPATACSLTLALAGASEELNRIDGDILQAGSNSVTVEKRGAGTWGIAGANTHTGQLRVLEGTLVILATVDGSYGVNGSPFGKTPLPSVYPVVGGDASNTITAAMLLADGVTIERAFTVPANAAQTVVIGGYSGTSSVASSVTPTLMRDVTLKANSGATVTFNNEWLTSGVDPTFTIDGGTVVLAKYLPGSYATYGGTTEAVLVLAGTLRTSSTIDNTIDPTTPVTIGAATLDINSRSQALASLTFTPGPATITNGTLSLGYTSIPYIGSSAGTVAVDGSGHEIDADVTLGNDTTITIEADSDLTVSGVVSGSGNLTLEGDGTLTLSSANTYSGTTTINGGTAVAGDEDAFGTGPIVVNAGGTLDKNGFALANTITNNGGTVLN